MKASVIIISRDQIENLKKSIPILKKQVLEDQFEIIVVLDSRTIDDSFNYLKSHNINTVLYKHIGNGFNYSKAFNLGAKESKGEILIRLSGDTIPIDKSLLFELTKPFEKPNIGGVFGKYVISGALNFRYPDFWPESSFKKDSEIISIKPSIFNYFNLKNRALILKLAGGCCSIRRSIWDNRHYNEALPESEDAEYSWYLHHIGYDIYYNSKAIVLHEHSVHNKTKTGLLNQINQPYFWILNLYIIFVELSTFIGFDKYKNNIRS